MQRYSYRPRPRRRHHWRMYIEEFSLYGVFIVVGVQGVRLLVRPTLLDGIVFVAAVVTLIPKCF